MDTIMDTDMYTDMDRHIHRHRQNTDMDIGMDRNTEMDMDKETICLKILKGAKIKRVALKNTYSHARPLARCDTGTFKFLAHEGFEKQIKN
jgi:hypothetical protein